MIQQVRVRNFKTLNEVSLELGQRNVIVGPNMSGKTNFISLFKFLNRMVVPAPGVHGLSNAVSSLGGFPEIAWRGGASNLISIALSGDFRGIEENGDKTSWEYLLEIVSDGRGLVTVQDEDLKITAPAGLYSVIRKDKSSGRRVLVSRERGAISEVDERGRSALEFEIPGWEGNKLRNFFASLRFYNFVPQLMKQINTAAAPPVLDEGGGNLSAWLLMLQTRFQEEFRKINAAVKDVLPDVASIYTFPTQQATVFVASGEKHFKSPVPVWQMSDGELCFIAWLSLIYSPPELTAPVYFVEEPENHLHPRLVDALIGLLDQAQTGAGANAAQLVATTHSLEVVDKTRLGDLIVFERRDGQTVCTRPREKTHLRELIAREEVGLGDLYYSGALGND